ncbi:hypothetical protein NDU88_001301 [Pleurodeles waltl]|uniref:Uncharacterized protein n=1 Tax=Pleurodeles waltl TaxID=8319 RepID=A0AAV7USE2_PLEWA|nr:hypothetical protein NDU88_001301 [Pleurodeles waltl]
MEVPLTQGAGARAAPDARSLPITVGLVVPLYAQKKTEAGEQTEMPQSLVRRGAGDSTQSTSSAGQGPGELRSPMGFSPLVTLPDAANVSNANQNLRLLTPQASGTVAQQLPVPNASNISLQGLTAQQLTSWLDSLNSSQGASKGEDQLNRMGLNIEANEISPKNIDWQRIDRTVEETKESIHTYYERLLKAFKEYSGKEAVEPKDMLHFMFRFVEGLRPEVAQMIKNHLICWQAKPIDEVLQYAKYCSDEIELKQKKLKEKACRLRQHNQEYKELSCH